MLSNLDATEKEEVLADAIREFRASYGDSPRARYNIRARLHKAQFQERMIEDTVSELLAEFNETLPKIPRLIR